PTNDAFGSFTLPVDQTLENVLFYHAYPGSFDSANLPAKADSALATSFPNPTNVSALITTDGGAAINGASVLVADVRTTNGIVHVIDTVLVPPTILDLAGIAGLTELAAAVTGQGLVPTLSGAGPYTVFAPTNMGFMNAPPVSGQTLTDVLLYHVVDLSFTSPVLEGDLTDGEVPTALGGTDTITVDLTAGTVEGAGLALTDVNGTNGTVHVIDAVMIPPSIAN
ncbi:MAG: fasciclin domain-containing protein, partial [Myxococcota bacterium]